MTIKKPPSPLTDATYEPFRKGKILHRVHNRGYGFAQFNPGKGRPTRFAPFDDVSGNPIPSLYATSTLQAAIHETIFHDIRADTEKKYKAIPIEEVHNQMHSEFRTKRTLNLVGLRNPLLNNWGIEQTQLIGSDPELYHKTALWAAAIYNNFPQAEGLIWTSRQCDPDDAILFFGGRVEAADFELISSRDMKDVTFFKDIRQEGKKRGIKITKPKKGYET